MARRASSTKREPTSRSFGTARGWSAKSRPTAAMRLPPVPAGLVRILDCDLNAAGIDQRDERGRTIDVHALRHSFGTLLSKGGVTPRTAQAAMRHSQIDLTMNVYTDPKLLDVYGALDSLPSLNLNATPSTGWDTMRATGTDDTPDFPGATANSFAAPVVAPNSGDRGQTVSFPVLASNLGDERPASVASDENPVKPSKKALPAVFAGKASEGWLTGFEPATSRTTIWRSNQLSYSHRERAAADFSEPVHRCKARFDLPLRHSGWPPASFPTVFLFTVVEQWNVRASRDGPVWACRCGDGSSSLPSRCTGITTSNGSNVDSGCEHRQRR